MNHNRAGPDVNARAQRSVATFSQLDAENVIAYSCVDSVKSIGITRIRQHGLIVNRTAACTTCILSDVDASTPKQIHRATLHVAMATTTSRMNDTKLTITQRTPTLKQPMEPSTQSEVDNTEPRSDTTVVLCQIV